MIYDDFLFCGPETDKEWQAIKKKNTAAVSVARVGISTTSYNVESECLTKTEDTNLIK